MGSLIRAKAIKVKQKIRSKGGRKLEHYNWIKIAGKSEDYAVLVLRFLPLSRNYWFK